VGRPRGTDRTGRGGGGGGDGAGDGRARFFGPGASDGRRARTTMMAGRPSRPAHESVPATSRKMAAAGRPRRPRRRSSRRPRVRDGGARGPAKLN